MRAETTLTLTPGRYELLCNIAGHYGSGMYTELDVTCSRPSRASPSATTSQKPLSAKAPAKGQHRGAVPAQGFDCLSARGTLRAAEPLECRDSDRFDGEQGNEGDPVGVIVFDFRDLRNLCGRAAPQQRCGRLGSGQGSC